MTAYDRHIHVHITVDQEIKKLASSTKNEVKYMSIFNHLISPAQSGRSICHAMGAQQQHKVMYMIDYFNRRSVCSYIEFGKRGPKSGVNTSHQGGDNRVKFTFFCTNFAFQPRVLRIGTGMVWRTCMVQGQVLSPQLSRCAGARRVVEAEFAYFLKSDTFRKTMWRPGNETKRVSLIIGKSPPRMLIIRVRKLQLRYLEITAGKKISHIVRFKKRINGKCTP